MKTNFIPLQCPIKKAALKQLRAGDIVHLSGTIYTARDIAHERLISTINANKKLPIPIENQVIYYVGPTPERENQIIGSAGPTSSFRMDKYMEPLLKLGLSATIGKGDRSEYTKQLLQKYHGVYFAAIGGIGALLAQKINKKTLIAYSDLLSGAIYELKIKDFPVIVANDIYGNDIFIAGKEKFKHHE